VPEILSVVRRVRVSSRYLYNLLISPPSDSVLKLLNSEVRQEIKAIFHLMPSTATGFLYVPKSCGRLGVPNFEHIVKLGILKNGVKMKQSIDPAVSNLINETIEMKFKKIVNSLRINWPATLEDIEKSRRRIKANYIKLWVELKSQGQGVIDFSRSKTGNVWLEEYNLFRPSRFIDALRLRTNTFGTRTVLARADKKIDVAYRKCRAQPETLRHILGLCQYTKVLRIKRHDEVKSILAHYLRKKNEVFIEPTL
jgi:hypothetical protein